MLRSAVSLLQDIIFPVYCAGCKKEGKWWCKECGAKIKLEMVQLCPVCEIESKFGKTCDNCKVVSNLDGVTAFFCYDEKEPLSKLIRYFKYHYAREIEEIWKETVNQNIQRLQELLHASVIIPVPLHPRRERERGFNQAKVLAKVMAESIHVSSKSLAPYSCVEPECRVAGLTRVRYTNQQAKLSKFERQKNISNAFRWNGDTKAPERVILVDDVFTTGATMQECAKVLKENGAEVVWGVTLARG